MAHPLYKATVQLPSQFREDPDRLEQREHALDSDGPHSIRELRFAYECVCNHDHYKGPFVTTISPDLLSVVTRAVRYFTNTNLEVLGTDHTSSRLVVKSQGQS